MFITNINRNHIKKLYKYIYSKTKDGVKIARTILRTSLVKASEESKIHMQVIFAVLMGLRKGKKKI